MKVNDLISFFADFYTDFDRVKANDMLDSLGIDPLNRLKTLSKGKSGEGAAHPHHEPKGAAVCAR